MKRKLRYDTPIRIICASLFAAFSFLYIYMLQGELLALVQDHLAQGQTSNNTFVTALLVTSLLMVLQFILNKGGRLHGRYEAISYLPSCMLLPLLTKVDNTFAYAWMQWGATLGVVAGIYVLAVWVDRNSLQTSDSKFLNLLVPNMGVMALMFVLSGWYGNDAPAQQMELAAWKYTHSERYDDVLGIGRHSDECNADLTALRNLALAKTGQLGDRLFAYPQPYASAGLMMNRYNIQTPSYGAKAYYDALGAHPYGGESDINFYQRMMVKTDSAIYRELYLSALLLEKDLTTFVAQTAGQGITTAPQHYQEAWVIYNEQHPFTPVDLAIDSLVVQRYRKYLSLREAHADNPEMVMRSLCKRQLGDTYWYYYDFVN